MTPSSELKLKIILTIIIIVIGFLMTHWFGYILCFIGGGMISWVFKDIDKLTNN